MRLIYRSMSMRLGSGARNNFVPPVIKSAGIKVKNRCKSAIEAKAKHALESFYPF